MAGQDTPKADQQDSTLAARFWSKVDRKSYSECWPFRAATRPEGYGYFKAKTKQTRGAHRIAWALENGPIPAGGVVRHSCDNPSCVNPKHLILGTHADNVADRVNRGRSAAGERHGRAKLTEQGVRFIRNSSDTSSALARRFGVDQRTIVYVRRGKNWKHVQQEGAA